MLVSRAFGWAIFEKWGLSIPVYDAQSSVLRIDQLRRERLSSNVLVVGVNFCGHFAGQNVQVSMGQNGMDTTLDHSILAHTHLYILTTNMAAETDAHD